MIMPVLSVRDVDASTAFYTDKLGFITSMTLKNADGENVWAIVNLGAATIGLSVAGEEGLPDNPAPGVGFMIYVPETTDIDQYYTDVQAKGVPGLSDLRVEYWGDKLFDLKDPNGYVLTMCKTVKQMTNEEAQEIMSTRQSP
jgi:uncharacterized glyoxalase superfamily protein PhnB